MPLKETAKAMERLKAEGVIRAIGVSNYSVDQIREFTNEVEIAAIQNPYNIFERGIEEAVLPYSQRNKLTPLAYRSLC